MGTDRNRRQFLSLVSLAVCPAKARVLYHGAEHTHMAQDSEHVKEDPGRAEDCGRAAQACERDGVAAASLPLPKPPTESL